MALSTVHATKTPQNNFSFTSFRMKIGATLVSSFDGWKLKALAVVTQPGLNNNFLKFSVYKTYKEQILWVLTENVLDCKRQIAKSKKLSG